MFTLFLKKRGFGLSLHRPNGVARRERPKVTYFTFFVCVLLLSPERRAAR